MTNQNSKVDSKKNENEQARVSEPKIDKKTDACKEKIEELENQNKRVLADYRNLENRIQNERGEWILKANKQLLLNILPVLDTLIQANKHSKDQSLALALQQFLGILEKEGVKRIEAEGKNFDPALMEGIGTVEGEEGKVISETRQGYMLYDKVLRPTQVIVGKKGDAEINSA
ncbi:MAG: nucleotide exchange factor GrpE [Candidatus Levybacteria bacterium]|nr:nucleotide exchange factor GrpE [Candidatus Levybacteria bacterium]